MMLLLYCLSEVYCDVSTCARRSQTILGMGHSLTQAGEALLSKMENTNQSLRGDDKEHAHQRADIKRPQPLLPPSNHTAEEYIKIVRLSSSQEPEGGPRRATILIDHKTPQIPRVNCKTISFLRRTISSLGYSDKHQSSAWDPTIRKQDRQQPEQKLRKTRKISGRRRSSCSPARMARPSRTPSRGSYSSASWCPPGHPRPCPRCPATPISRCSSRSPSAGCWPPPRSPWPCP